MDNCRRTPPNPILRVLSAAVQRRTEGLIKREPKVEAKKEVEAEGTDDEDDNDDPVSCTSLTESTE